MGDVVAEHEKEYRIDIAKKREKDNWRVEQIWQDNKQPNHFCREITVQLV